MILCFSRAWKWNFLGWKAELGLGVSGPSDGAWRIFWAECCRAPCGSQVPSSPSQAGCLGRKQCLWGGATTPAAVGEVRRNGKHFGGKSAAARRDSPHSWAWRALSSSKCLGQGTMKGPGQLRQPLQGPQSCNRTLSLDNALWWQSKSHHCLDKQWGRDPTDKFAFSFSAGRSSFLTTLVRTLSHLVWL